MVRTTRRRGVNATKADDAPVIGITFSMHLKGRLKRGATRFGESLFEQLHPKSRDTPMRFKLRDVSVYPHRHAGDGKCFIVHITIDSTQHVTRLQAEHVVRTAKKFACNNTRIRLFNAVIDNTSIQAEDIDLEALNATFAAAAYGEPRQYPHGATFQQGEVDMKALSDSFDNALRGLLDQQSKRSGDAPGEG